MTSAFWRAARTDVAPYVYEVVGDVLPAGFDSYVTAWFHWLHLPEKRCRARTGFGGVR